MLLPARHQRLFEEAADRFAADKTQMAGPVGQREDALRKGRAQPLEIERQVGRIEVVAGLAGRLRRLCAAGASTSTSGTSVPLASRSQPSSPQTHFWIAVSRPSGERLSPGSGREAEMGVIDLAVWRLDDLAVAGALQRRVWRILRGHEMRVGMKFIRPVDLARARHGDGMIVASAALGGGHVVPAVALEEVRTFDQPVRTAGKDVLHRADELLRDRVVLLQ